MEDKFWLVDVVAVRNVVGRNDVKEELLAELRPGPILELELLDVGETPVVGVVPGVAIEDVLSISVVVTGGGGKKSWRLYWEYIEA